MSRYYDITINDPLTGKAVKQWSSHPNGIYDPQAQNVEFDILAYSYAIPKGASTVTIEGIDIADIGQANSYTGFPVTIKGGMKDGLPLANPSQAGFLLSGQVFQGFGNWEGTDMTLDLVVMASPYTYDQPGNFVLNLPAGGQYGPAIKAMLQGVFGASNLVVNVSPNRVSSSKKAHVFYYHTLEQASEALSTMTQGQLCAADPGVVITLAGNGTVLVFDYSEPSGVKNLSFYDFVGQPTWIGPLELQVKMVLRADLSVGTMVKMPEFKKSPLPNAPGIVTTQAGSLPGYTAQNSIFQGDFFVTSLRHVGNFRDPNGASWVTIANLVSAGSVGCG